MLNSLKGWVTVLSFASIVATMVEIMCPNGKLERIVRMVLSAFLLYSVAMPISVVVKQMPSFVSQSRGVGVSEKLKKKYQSKQLMWHRRILNI